MCVVDVCVGIAMIIVCGITMIIVCGLYVGFVVCLELPCVSVSFVCILV